MRASYWGGAVIAALLLPAIVGAQSSASGPPQVIGPRPASATGMTVAQSPPVVAERSKLDQPLVCLPAAPGVGQQHFLGVDFLFGTDLGVRGQFTLLRERDVSGVLEVIGGRFNTAFGEGNGVGVGGRVLFTACSDHDNDALILGPGLSLRYFQDQDAREDKDRLFLATDLDVAWLHDFSPKLGWELGIKVGVGVGLSGHEGHGRWRDDDILGDLTGVFSFYTGLRF